MMCMFQHEKSDEDDESDDDDHNNAEDSLIQVRDLEPSIKKVEEAMEKVNVLLKKHSSEISTLRGLVTTLPGPGPEYPFWDDIFLLRYILSFKTAAAMAGQAHVVRQRLDLVLWCLLTAS